MQLWRVWFRWPLVIPTSSYSHPCAIPSWVWSGPNDLHVINKMWLKWGDVTCVIRLQETVTFVLLINLLCHTLPCWLWWRSIGEPFVARISRLPPFHSRKDTETSSPKNLQGSDSWQQLCKHGRGAFPSWAFRWDPSLDWHLAFSLVRPWTEDPAKLCPDSQPRDALRWHVYVVLSC